MKKFFLFSIILVLFASCNDSEDDTALKQYIDIATVENPTQDTRFVFVLDDTTKIKTSSSLISYYRPKNGQRIIANYSLLTETPDSLGFSYKAQLNDVYEILTKGIFNITPATQDSIGNDYINIDQMWIGSHFLNVEFVYLGNSKTHFINLVSDNSKTYTDGKVHLEFRHNANGDYPMYSKRGIVSFDLKSLESGSSGQAQLVIHVNEYGKSTNETYSLTYKYGSGAQNVKPQKVLMGELTRQFK